MRGSRVILLFSALMMSMQLAAQNGSISGQVSHSGTGETIPYANVSLYNTIDSSLVNGLVTNEEGRFEIKRVPFGHYALLISFIGFETDTLLIDLDRQHSSISMPVVNLKPAELEMNAVEVTAMASSSVSKIDRKTYRAEDFATAKGGTAVDFLNKLPSVSVSPDGEVSVRGTTDFMVYLNGKPTQMDPSMLLAQISGDMIKKIDIITVPTARYDAQGKGGIINITTKRAGQEGFSASINGLLGGAPWGHKTDQYSDYQLNDNRYGGGLNLSYVKNKLSLYGGANYKMRNVNGSRTGDARLLQSDGSYYHMVAAGERPEWYENSSAYAGFDYKISDKTSLAGNYNFARREDGRSAFYVYHNFFANQDKQAIEGIAMGEDWIYNPNTDVRYGLFNTASLDINHMFDSENELSVSVLYENSGLTRELDNQNYAFDASQDQVGGLEAHFMQTDNTPLQGFRFSAEYLKNLGDNHTLQIGFQPQFFAISGAFGYDTLSTHSNEWEAYSSLENSIDLNRGIYAGYLDYQGRVGPIDIAAGLRYEYTDQVFDIENPDYFSIFERETQSSYVVQQGDWFPNLHLQYKTSKKGAFQMAASKRISRPPIKNMAPFLYRRHYEVYLVGDPDLKPEYLSNFEMSYNRIIGSNNISLTGFSRGTENAVFRVNTVYEEEKVLIRSYTNSGNTKATGAEMNGNFQLGSRTKLFLGASLYNYRIEADIFGFKEDNSSLNWNLKGNLNIFLLSELRFTADFDLKSATVTAQGQNELFYLANAAIEYAPEALKGWVFSIRGLDLLGSNITGLNTRAYDQTGVQIFYQETEYTRYGPILEFQANYSLNWKNKKSSESEFGKKEF